VNKKIPIMANYDIEIKDIFLYEKEEALKTSDSQIYKELISVIKPIIVNHDTPVFDRNQTKNYGIALKGLLARGNENKKDSLDIFEWRGECFSYSKNEHIVQPDNNRPDFAFLFALKLRQFRQNLIGLDEFLVHQFKTNFQEDTKAFMYFLQRIYVAYDQLFGATSQKFKETIDLWEQNYKQEPGDTLLQKDLNWSKIVVSLTDDQVMAYFSFLYLEKNNHGIPYLEKSEVEKLLEFGFKVPPKPLLKKFRLNLTPQHRKSILEICVYILFDKYALNLKNKLPFLQFLAFQFEPFEKYQGSEELKKWGKNFTPQKLNVQSLPFKIQVYLDKLKSA
jgi:hypothetical protein